jgi:hypothetical protein
MANDKWLKSVQIRMTNGFNCFVSHEHAASTRERLGLRRQGGGAVAALDDIAIVSCFGRLPRCRGQSGDSLRSSPQSKIWRQTDRIITKGVGPFACSRSGLFRHFISVLGCVALCIHVNTAPAERGPGPWDDPRDLAVWPNQTSRANSDARLVESRRDGKYEGEPLILYYSDWYAPNVGLVRTRQANRPNGNPPLAQIELVAYDVAH